MDNNCKVLIIDDDPLDRDIYKRYLRSASGMAFEFAEEASGTEGLARIPVFQPDCVLLDYTLPDMTGLELLDRLRNGAALLPAAVVMLTGVRDERIAIDVMKRGVMDYLPKGQIASDTIYHAVNNAVEKFRMQREIENQQRRYRSLIEAIPQVVWTATPAGDLDFANSRWYEYLGLSLEDFNRIGWGGLLHTEDKERSLNAWTSGLASGAPFQIEHRLRGGAGDVFRWHLTRAVPVLGADGSVTKWFGTSTDVEDQKRREMAVFNKQKLESLGLLAGGIAHDFNNLLCGILGGASLVAEALPLSHPQQPVLADIVTASERAAHLTRQMLAYAGKGRFLVQQVDINELVRSTCDLIKASIPRNVVITLQMRQDLPAVEADTGQMQQVMMNLILNAAESIEESRRGSVIVKTDLVEIDAACERSPKTELVAGSLGSGRYIVVQVQDNGSGMTAATRDKIFDPFFTTKVTGRGLGLSAVEGILRAQNGGMELQTAVDKGSMFRVYLPASSRPREEQGKKNGEREAAHGIRTVLVVDDEDMVRRTAKLSLENGGFAVRLAESGEEAIRILLSHGDSRISLVVLDLSMPGMGGKEVMQQIRMLKIEVPVLICSGYGEVEVFEQFSGLDIAGFIQKPFTSRQLAARVNTVLYPEQTVQPGQSQPA